MAGNKFYVLTNSADVSVAYRNTTSLSFDIFAERLMKSCGCSTQAVKTMFEVPQSENSEFPNPCGKRFTALTHDIHTRQLYPGENLDSMGNLFAQYFQDHLCQENIFARYAAPSRDSNPKSSISLWQMCSQLLVNAGQNVYFGRILSDIDPTLARTFLHFDDLSWQLLFNMPRTLSREMHQSQDKLIDALDRYFLTSSTQRQDAAWSIGVLEREMRRLGLSNRELATMMMILYWG